MMTLFQAPTMIKELGYLQLHKIGIAYSIIDARTHRAIKCFPDPELGFVNATVDYELAVAKLHELATHAIDPF